MLDTATGAALLAAILEAPEDDLRRLIYADWLEEQGQVERSEFIRTQCKLASLIEPEKGMCGYPYGSCERCAYRRRFARHKNALRQRERELLAQKGNKWVSKILRHPEYEWHDVTYAKRVPADGRHTVNEIIMAPSCAFSRGFVEHIALTLDDFLAHAKSLFLAAPITSVRLVDRSPGVAGNGWKGWYRREPASDTDELPYDLWACLRGCLNDLGTWKWYDTDGLANEALSRACVCYGRKLAGLSEVAR